jgi:transposase IS204/IS1001/IS1096/IS1165 family protein
MHHDLRTLITTLLPPTCAVRLTEVTLEQASVRLQLTAMAPSAACPRCTVLSSSVHSRYQRHLTDLPWGTCTVRIQLRARKFVCRNPRCERRIFTERVPELVAAYARNTHRLITVLRAGGMALGGNAEARLAARLRLPTSPATLLRLVRTPRGPPPRLLKRSVSTSGPGGEVIGMAPSWLISRRLASSTCCRTARRRASRPGWPSIRRSA